MGVRKSATFLTLLPPYNIVLPQQDDTSYPDKTYHLSTEARHRMESGRIRKDTAITYSNESTKE